ncbi:MAG: hypothetical protein ACTHOC_12790 [Luteimonas sp.]
MSSNKFGSMFDDDDDLEGIPHSPDPVPDAEPSADRVGLINDEAAALIDAKAKQAAEQAQRAAKAGLAAASRAAEAVKNKGRKLKEKASTRGQGSKRPLVIGLVVLVVVASSAFGWWVWSGDAGHEETHQPQAPVMVIPAASPGTSPQELTAKPEQAPAEVDQETVPEQPELMPSMPVFAPAEGRYVPPQSTPEPTPVQETRAEPRQAAVPPVAEERAPVRKPVEQPAPDTKPASVPSVASRSSKPRRSDPAATKPAETIGAREQQQIDQIHALFGNKP